jgi:hypothetical protein
MAFRRAGFSLLVLAALMAALVWACGPSIRRTYQSDNAFARCFDMDYRPESTIEEKEQCWSTWLEKHVFNQPPDKVGYARLRLREIADGISTPGPPGEPGSFDRRPTEGPDTGAAEPEKEAPDEKVLATTKTAQEKSCEANCKAVADTCSAACTADAGVNEVCRRACDEGEAWCLKLCADAGAPAASP